jgi:protein-S-isoprenylcysteine O-methyltransferase Ste14
MSLIPEFDIGIWNAWILTAFIFFHALLLSIIFKDKQRSSDKISLTPTENRIDRVRSYLLYLMFLYSVFLPITINTLWFWVGLLVYLKGIVLYTIVMVNWYNSPNNKLVSTGLYKYSRHPQYLTQIEMFLGIGIATASWLFSLLFIAYTILNNKLLASEERYCSEKFGTEYNQYISITPRWIGIPKS